IGAGWSLRRAANAFGMRRSADPTTPGWPDTETCIGLILKDAGITPKFLGRETNDENQETEYWIHARSRNALGMTPRHRHAFLQAMVQLSHWYKEEGIEPTNPGHSSISKMVVGCPFREVL